MMLKHTPAPWYTHDWTANLGKEPFEIETRQVEVLAPGQSSLWPGSIVRQQVATTRESCFDSATNIANARLIAAAPDLLLALSWLVGLKDARPADYEEQKPLAWAAARAAIRQATEE